VNILLIVLITLVSIALIILIVYTVVFLVLLIKALKQVRIAADKVQESANSAADLVDEVRRTVVNPGIIAMMIEKYLHKAGKRSRKDKNDE
jgi:biopolymer transport protein ExbB/TolQ